MRFKVPGLALAFLAAVLAIGCSGAPSTTQGAPSGQPTQAPSNGQTTQSSSGQTMKIGWLTALTGANNAPGVAMDRGMKYAVEKVNGTGGIKGRKIEMVTRDTQGDPTKAVNDALQLINNDKVDFMLGPTLSGETLATGPVLAKNNVPDLVLGTVDELIDPGKFPLAFRVLPANSQWIEAANNYVVQTLGKKKVALIGDTTGYGTDSVAQAEKMLKAAGATVTYKNLIDVNQTDVTADVQKSKDSGAEAVTVWTASTGLDARLLNARGEIGWNVPFVGHPTLGSGAVKALLKDPNYWKNVDIVGYRTMSYDDNGSLPPATQKFLDEGASTLVLSDTSLWWVAGSWDCVQLVKYAVEQAGSTDPKAMAKALETVKDLKLVYGQYSYNATSHNGYNGGDVVMNTADSFKNGVYKLAPGYSTR